LISDRIISSAFNVALQQKRSIDISFSFASFFCCTAANNWSSRFFLDSLQPRRSAPALVIVAPSRRIGEYPDECCGPLFTAALPGMKE
jgi:hypothetical protein